MIREGDALVRPTTSARTLKVDGSSTRVVDDRVAVESPLGIELDGELVATTMRTPGDDRALALGFLRGEGYVTSMTNVENIAVESAECDLVRVQRRADHGLPRVEKRLGTITSACGACGKVGIEELLASAVLDAPRPTIAAESLRAAHRVLMSRQPCFTETGGIHAAAVFAEDGRCLASAEDVGRHNAVDKAIGRALAEGTLAEARLLVVSGRTSFEIVHKALVSGIAAVSGVSAPSSLAVQLADRAGMMLAGFVRGDSMNVYAHAERFVAGLPVRSGDAAGSRSD